MAILLVLSGCGVQFTDFNFSGRPAKLTLSVPSAKEVENRVAKSLPAGPESYLSLETKVQSGVVPLQPSDALFVKVHEGRINALIPFDDSSVISAGDDGKVIRTRLVEQENSLEFVSETLLSGSKSVLAMALSPDRKFLAVAQTSLIVVYNLLEKGIDFQLTRVRGRVSSLGWDPRGELLGIGLAGGDVYLWSLRQSFFGGQGKDSYDAIEHYLGAESPIVGLQFHPSGGAFFTAEWDGNLSVWRALRTEEELGLRDKFSLKDREAVSSTRQVFAKVPSIVTDSALAEDGSYYFVSSADGRLSSWKTRGLVQQTQTTVSGESLLSFSPLRLQNFPTLSLIMTSTQDQKIQLLCLKRLGENTGAIAQEYLLLAETPPLRETFSIIRPGHEQIWAAEKADSIVLLRKRSIASALSASQRLQECSRE